jgi:hypothetical protein
VEFNPRQSGHAQLWEQTKQDLPQHRVNMYLANKMNYIQERVAVQMTAKLQYGIIFYENT